MLGLIVVIVISILGGCMSIKWDMLNLSTDFKGIWNSTDKYWTGGLYECDQQCEGDGYQICG
jgi:hypothetical protein